MGRNNACCYRFGKGHSLQGRHGMTLSSVFLTVLMTVGIEISGCFESDFQKNRKEGKKKKKEKKEKLDT